LSAPNEMPPRIVDFSIARVYSPLADSDGSRLPRVSFFT